MELNWSKLADNVENEAGELERKTRRDEARLSKDEKMLVSLARLSTLDTLYAMARAIRKTVES